jgi:hypothetical protein
MKAIFTDLQQAHNPLNGKCLESAGSIAEMLRSLSDRAPFLFRLRGENGFTLMVGLAEEFCIVEYSRNDGSPPYLIATLEENSEDAGCLEYLAGNTPTPIPRCFGLPIAVLEQVVSEFFENGGRSGTVTWEEI